MAEDVEEDFDEEPEGEEESRPSKGGKKKLLLMVVLPVLLVIGGAAGAYFAGLADPVMEMLGGSSEEQTAEENTGGDGEGEGAPGAARYELSEILVDLNTTGRKRTFLKIRVVLDLEREGDVSVIEAELPRIVDNFQVYLRELRLEDLQGSAGMYRLKEELLRRVNMAVKPVRVKDVLFDELLIQ